MALASSSFSSVVDVDGRPERSAKGFSSHTPLLFN
jgi:hypothetical protein